MKSVLVQDFKLKATVTQSQTLTGQTISRLRAVLGVPVNVQESNCLKPNKVQYYSLLLLDMLHLSLGN